MNICKLFLVTIVLSLASLAAGTSPDNFPLSFPFFESGQSSGILDELMVGYGDWCVASEGLHPGIDFFASSGTDQVLNPFDQALYSLGAHYNQGSDFVGCMIGIGSYGSDDGWALIHLGPNEERVTAHQWCANHSRGLELPARTPIDKCCQYSSMPLHLHVQWSHWVFSQFAPGGYILTNPWETLENPFSSFVPGALLGYDQIGFKRV